MYIIISNYVATIQYSIEPTEIGSYVVCEATTQRLCMVNRNSLQEARIDYA